MLAKRSGVHVFFFFVCFEVGMEKDDIDYS